VTARNTEPAIDFSSWSPWQPVQPALTLSPGGLAELLDGGQSFRWWRQPDGSWLGQWDDHIARLRISDSTTLEWSSPAPPASAVADALPRYLALDPRHVTAIDALPWRSDSHLQSCLAEFPGLRILRQPFGEALLGFLCSATKQIVQIKQMITLLAARFGSPTPGARVRFVDGSQRRDRRADVPGVGAIGFRLPTWEQLAAVTEKELRECLLGFRARYIHATAEFLAATPGWLGETEHLPYAEAKARLCTLPGVGEKVADCVLLFGAARWEAFPVDVWILKAMARRYGLEGWPPSHVAQFGRVHFGAYAGLAQQYLFAFERRDGRTKS
jgi:N-glycosylase/DNA lyase